MNSPSDLLRSDLLPCVWRKLIFFWANIARIEINPTFQNFSYYSIFNQIKKNTQIKVTHLFRLEPRRHPGILFQGAPRVVVRVSVSRGGGPEVRRHLGDDALALRHVRHPRRTLVLLPRALAVPAHLPGNTKQTAWETHTFDFDFWATCFFSTIFFNSSL